MADKQTWERKIIEAGYRQLAKRNHPDKGGSPDVMAALNAAVNNLRAVDNAALSYEEYTGAPLYVNAPPSPLDSLRDLAAQVIEFIDHTKTPRSKRPRRR